ncbi:hypothetical protein ACWGB8_30220 [Kitasatospora sp. NPDC054939]
MLSILPPTDPAESEVYLEWLRAGSPGAEEGARRLLDVLRTGYGRAHHKPGRFLDELKGHARRLPPEHLPWFWDTVGHRLGRSLPRLSGQAYQLARTAERDGALAVDETYQRANTLLFARLGVLPGKELSVHQRRLTATLPPADAHREFVAFVAAWSDGGAAPAADLHTRLRATARAAGLGTEEDARVLGEVLAAARGRAVPDALLTGAARLLADHPPTSAVAAALLELFPSSDTDAGAWLRLLRACGAADALADGRLTPEDGPAGWLGRLAFLYSYARSGGGVTRRQLPAELFDLLPLLAPRLRADAVPVRLHESRWTYSGLDADLADACLAAGIPVETPPGQVRLHFWGAAARRDLAALAADPVLGARLEGTVHAGLRRGTALTRLPENPGIARSVHGRVTGLLEALDGGGLGAAEEAVDTLERLLDRPTASALDGIEEALAALDPAGPLLRTLRAGLPEELCWPALETAIAELGGEPTGTTSSWPVLTVYTRTAAVAVDHRGRRAGCPVHLPEDAAAHQVHHVGGDFLISWNTTTAHGYPDRAYWASRPDEVFEPGDYTGLTPVRGAGYQFATADGTGRHDGERVLRPGGREGAGDDHELQLGDGTGLWSCPRFLSRSDWARCDPATGGRTADRQLPAFFTDPPLPEGHQLCPHLISLAPLPAGAGDSPLGGRAGLVGFRVTRRADGPSGAGARFRLEGTDGRTADFRAERAGQGPWGIVDLPAGGARCIVTDEQRFRAHDAADNSLLWQADFATHRLPAPAFWHFLTARHPGSSRALRELPEDTARALLATARAEAESNPAPGDRLRDELARLLPALTDPRIADAAAQAARRAVAVQHRRERLCRRVAVVRSGRLVPPAPVSDADLLPALRGLFELPRHHDAEPMSPQPATLTALAADGAHLRGELDEQERRLSAPARAREWTTLLGRIDAAAWRLVTAATGSEDRIALAALLRTWAAQPFAGPGTAWRLGEATGAALAAVHATGRPALAVRADRLSRLAPIPHQPLQDDAEYLFLQPAADPAPVGAHDLRTVTVQRDDAHRLRRLLTLHEEHGPIRIGEDAVDAFVARTGARRPLARLVLDGLPERGDHQAQERLLAAKPYQATPETVSRIRTALHRLGTEGRLELLAAAVPDDPDELRAPGGTVAAAQRAAEVWARLVGVERPVDEAAAADLERDLGLGARSLDRLTEPPAPTPHSGPRSVLAATRHGYLHLHAADGDGNPAGIRFGTRTPVADDASLLVWALTERPVGDPLADRAPQLLQRIVHALDDPDLVVAVDTTHLPGDAAERARLFGPRTYPVLPGPDRARPGQPATPPADLPTVHDDGLLLVPAGTGPTRLWLRPAALADPAARNRLLAYGRQHDLGPLLLAVRRLEDLRTGGGLQRMVQRAAATPVPAGRYEADPRQSVPQLVQEAAEVLGVDGDAAALLLQLLALARPTDRNVRRWNSWTPARHKAAQQQLTDAGLVETGKRPRAGRTVFVPGPWTEFKAPELPLESAKSAAHLAAADRRKELEGPLLRLLPTRPLHELFEEAWQAHHPSA